LQISLGKKKRSGLFFESSDQKKRQVLLKKPKPKPRKALGCLEMEEGDTSKGAFHPPANGGEGKTPGESNSL